MRIQLLNYTLHLENMRLTVNALFRSRAHMRTFVFGLIAEVNTVHNSGSFVLLGSVSSWVLKREQLTIYPHGHQRAG
jgi:hypothetical protein